jgi:hypothetical protein
MTHRITKINNIVQTPWEEIIGKTAKSLVWDRNGPPGPKSERMMIIILIPKIPLILYFKA